MLLISKTLNPNPLSFSFSFSVSHFPNPNFNPKTLPIPKPPLKLPRLASHFPPNLSPPPPRRRDLRAAAAKRDKTKYKARESAANRIVNDPELRRQLRLQRARTRRRGKKYADSFFLRLKNPHSNKSNFPDNFSESELQEIGLGYDRLVRFMDKDDPNLKHPFDWYKYGQYGPYSWRGVVIGDPVRGRFSDERVAMISEVRDAEEWERIDQFEMGQKFGKRLDEMDRTKFRYFWVFVRHPRWRLSEKPWEQWTLVSEVVLEAGDQRLDKWNLMGRLGSVTRSLITKCAAWMRPDIIYVKKPVYQCRFEPQDNFFRSLVPFLDPKTEKDCLFELEDEDGNVDLVTYFGGLCKIVKVSPKAFVDDVVNAYEKLSDEEKSKCLGFLLGNHPVHLLHPYTKEWKAKLEELELGCDAPEEDDVKDGAEIVDWIEEEDNENDGNDGVEIDEDDNVVMEMEEDEDDNVEEDKEGDYDEDDEDNEENKKRWEDEFRKAFESPAAMEKLVKRSVETSTAHYGKQINEMEKMAKSAMEAEESEVVEDKEEEEGEGEEEEDLGDVAEDEDEEEEDDTDVAEDVVGDQDETEMRGKYAKVSPEEWKIAGIGPWRRRIRKSRIPPELFLRGAVRLFTYRNLVKEIVLTRHAIVDGDIGSGSNNTT